MCLLKALAERPVTLLAGDIDPYAAGLYLVESDQRVILPRGDDPHFADLLLACCEHESVDVVVPTVDSELIPLAARRTQFEQAGVRLVLAPLSTLEVCLDKWTLHACCHDQIRVPDTMLLDEEFDAASAPLPAIVKPRVGSGSRGDPSRRRCRGFRSSGARPALCSCRNCYPVPSIPLDVLATSKGCVIAVVPRERLKIDSGIAVTARTRHDNSLERIGREVAELIGLTGVANVQVKGDVHGEPALLEVNPRFPGTMALTIASGPDMAWLCVADALGEPMPRQVLPFADIAMVRFFQERFLSFDEIARLQATLSGAAQVSA